MTKHSHNFVDTYEGLLAFGLDRATDENTVICYLQKLSDDQVMEKLRHSLSDEELGKIYEFVNELISEHLSHGEYHKLFLKDP